MWFNNNWLYRKRLFVKNTNPYPITYGHIYLEFSYSDIQSYVNDNLSDIRFVDHGNGTQNQELYHHFRYIDTMNKRAGVVIKVTDVPANGTKVIFMYFGNSNATVSQYRDPNNTYDFYLDISSIQNTITLDNYLEIYDVRNRVVSTFTNNTVAPFVTFNTTSKTIDISNAVDIVVRIKDKLFGRLQKLYVLAKPSDNTGSLFGCSWFETSFYTSSENVIQTDKDLRIRHISNGIEGEPVTVSYAPNTSTYNFCKLRLTSSSVSGSISDTRSLGDYQSVSIQSIVNRTQLYFGMYNYGIGVSSPTNVFTPTQVITDVSYGTNYGIGVGFNGYCVKFSSSTYSTVNTGVTEKLNSVLVDGTKVVIVGENGVLLVSSDSGSSFTRISTGISYGLNRVRKIGSYYYIVGNQGTIIRLDSSNNIVVYSTTGNTNVDLYDIDGDGNSKLICTGTGGNIIFSDNNGNVWSSRTVDVTSNNLYSISYIGNSTFLIGTHSSIVVTNDNGSTFNLIRTGRFIGSVRKLVKIPSTNITYGYTDTGYIVYVYDNNLTPYEVRLTQSQIVASFAPSFVWYYNGSKLQTVSLLSQTASYKEIFVMTTYDKELTCELSTFVENSIFPVNSLKLLQSAYLQEPSKKYVGTCLFDRSDNKLKLWDGSNWLYTGLKVLTPTEIGFLTNWASGEVLTPGEQRVIGFTGQYDIDMRGVKLDQNASPTNPAIYHLRWFVYSITPPPPVPVTDVTASFPDLRRVVTYVVDNNSPESIIPSYQFSFTVNLPNPSVDIVVTDPNTLSTSVDRRILSSNSVRYTVTVRPRVRPGVTGIRRASVVVNISSYSYEPVTITTNFAVEYVNYDAGTERYDIDNQNYRIVAVRRIRPVINVIQNIIVVQQVIVNTEVRCPPGQTFSSFFNRCITPNPDYAIQITPTFTSGSFDITKVRYGIMRSTDSGDFVGGALSQTFAPTVGIPIVVNEGYVDNPYAVIDIHLYYFGSGRDLFLTYTGTNEGGIGYGVSRYLSAPGITDLGYIRFIAQDRRFFRQSGYLVISRIS